MAAGIDIVAGTLGIVGVAQQLTQSAFAVKSFCSKVRNAPSELQDSLDRIQSLARVIGVLESKIFGDTTTFDLRAERDVLRTSLELCQKDVEGFIKFAIQLRQNAEHKSIRTGVRIVLKEEMLLNWMQRLDQSRVDMHFAYLIYTDALRSREHRVLCQQSQHNRDMLAQMIKRATELPAQDMLSGSAVLSKSGTSDNAPIQSMTRRTARRHRPRRDLVRIRFPSWLGRHAWDVVSEYAAGIWTVSLKSFIVLPSEHPAFRMAQQDDVTGLQDLLVRRHVSLHDQDVHGQTLFLYLMTNALTEVPYQVLLQSLSGNMVPDSIVSDPWASKATCPESVRIHAKFILGECDAPDINFLDALAKPRESWTIEERLLILTNVAMINKSRAFRELFRSEDLEHQYDLDIDTLDDRMTYLHLLASRWGWDLLGYASPAALKTSEWQVLIKKGIEGNVGVHAPNEKNVTPFGVFVQNLAKTRLSEPIQAWAAAIKACGIDFLEYGRTEEALMFRAPSSLDFAQWQRFGFVRFQYGAEPGA